MELLLAVLIGLGVLTSGEAEKMAGDEKAISQTIDQNKISQKQIDDQTAIIEMEDTDM
ncbi:MAG: hypothetical protein JKX84_06010 [Flavobacteriales bacterium]|nr:hypothetical protein [Flavobacteriales bacterium]